ncbi:MAG TPA: PaaI family thioesterase [Anaeromyxobacteraceae bacterium]|nr:PaaI family thioesterase [Anaeromyxobacteraceae bacterium]
MDLKDPQALERIRQVFEGVPFLRHLGIRLAGLGPGWAESVLQVGPHLGQAEGFVHAGAVATMADHSCGTAAGTLTRADQTVLTVEFKVSLLRPAVGDSLRCRAEVIRAGSRLVFAEAQVFALAGGEEKLVATFTSTLALVERPGA